MLYQKLILAVVLSSTFAITACTQQTDKDAVEDTGETVTNTDEEILDGAKEAESVVTDTVDDASSMANDAASHVDAEIQDVDQRY